MEYSIPGLFRTINSALNSCLRKGLLVVGFLLQVTNVSAADKGIQMAPLAAHFDANKQQQLELSIGVPNNYWQRGIPLKPPSGEGVDKEAVPKKYILANEYELLDWIENARIDAAYVPKTSVDLLKHLSTKDEIKRYRVVKVDKKHVYRNSLSATQNGKSLSEPLKHYERVLVALQNREPVKFKLFFDTHLQPALYALYNYTDNWMRQRTVAGQEKEYIWSRLIERLRFMMADNMTGATQSGDIVFSGIQSIDCGVAGKHVDCISDKVQDDYLVIRSEVLEQAVYEKLFGLEEKYIFDTSDNAFDKLLHNTEPAMAPVRNFVVDNYASHQSGVYTKRYFRFRIPELLSIIAPSEKRYRSYLRHKDQGRNLSLVLTGGGVKAAYQTRLVDYLYDTDSSGDAYLVNKHDSATDTAATNTNKANTSTTDTATTSGRHTQRPSSKPLTVDSVIGTSGGALLGLFVSTHDSANRFSYTDILWRKQDGDYLSSLDVFPGLDMMRYLSFLVVLFVFVGMTSLFFHFPYFKRKYGLDVADSFKYFTDNERVWADKGSRFFRFTLVWLLFMLVSPWIIKYVNGEIYREHVPAIQGVAYFIMILAAVNADNQIVRLAQAREQNSTLPRKWKVIGLVGVLLTLLPVFWKYRAQQQAEGYVNVLENTVTYFNITMTAQSLLCITGMVMLSLTLHRWYLEESRFFQKIQIKNKKVQYSFLVPLFVVLASTLIVVLLYLFDLAALLEITVDFWKVLLVVAALITLLCLILGFATIVPEKPRTVIQCYLRYLMLPHPAKTLLLPLNRIVRMSLLFIAAFAWWNMVVAPGLYGNGSAKGYISGAWHNVQEQRNNSENDNVRFTAYYVAPATSLDKNIERYFLYDPGKPMSSIQPSGDSDVYLPYDVQKEISADRRWTQFKNGQLNNNNENEELLAIAFASGSPFPVFPAHNIKITTKENDSEQTWSEWLVDGGYAHNIPIEAAKKLGASHVLVVSASPMTPVLQEPSGERFFEPGLMTQNLTRLVPYFYNRSQVEDVLSAHDIFVAVLAPPWPAEHEPAWPILTDFRADVIDYLLKRADADLNQRIGFVQNWGDPSI